jgi:hypothetical protein
MEALSNLTETINYIYFYKLYKPHRTNQINKLKRDVKWIYYRDRYKAENFFKKIIEEFKNNDGIVKAVIMFKHSPIPYTIHK